VVRRLGEATKHVARTKSRSLAERARKCNKNLKHQTENIE